jgi:hypothetical protein
VSINWSLRRSERMVSNSAENASETAVQEDRLVPWSTSDGYSRDRLRW